MQDDKENKLYTDFVGKNVQDGITADNFDSLKDNGFITPENKEFFEDLLRTGWLSGQLSSSGPLIGSIQFKTVNGVDNSTGYVDFGDGIWAVQDVIVYYTGGSGTISFRGWYFDGVTPIEWYLGGSSSSSYFSYNADSQFDELSVKRFGGNMQLGLKPNGTFDADSMTFYVVCYRVR